MRKLQEHTELQQQTITFWSVSDAISLKQKYLMMQY